jgi:hypothetical protein
MSILGLLEIATKYILTRTAPKYPCGMSSPGHLKARGVGPKIRKRGARQGFVRLTSAAQESITFQPVSSAA